MLFVQVTMNAGRSVEVKQALYARIADEAAAHGFRREDVIVSLVEVPRENWSFGGGAMSYPPAGT
jgi:phenylpyruvate tautomerase PptA (4-oxalocrotonate tautomerase family)